MKPITHLAVAFLIAMVLTSCGESNVELVKSGAFTDHQNTTVGRAFDAWVPCDSTLWESFETDNGTNIVEYHCFIRESKKIVGQELFSKALRGFSSVEEADKEITRSVCTTKAMSILFDTQAILQGALNEKQTCNFTLARYIRALATTQSVKVQFTVNLDSTFNVSYVGHKVGEYDYNEGMDIGSVVSVIMGNEDVSEIYDAVATAFAMNASESDLVSEQEAVSFLNL